MCGYRCFFAICCVFALAGLFVLGVSTWMQMQVFLLSLPEVILASAMTVSLALGRAYVIFSLHGEVRQEQAARFLLRVLYMGLFLFAVTLDFFYLMDQGDGILSQAQRWVTDQSLTQLRDLVGWHLTPMLVTIVWVLLCALLLEGIVCLFLGGLACIGKPVWHALSRDAIDHYLFLIALRSATNREQARFRSDVDDIRLRAQATTDAAHVVMCEARDKLVEPDQSSVGR